MYHPWYTSNGMSCCYLIDCQMQPTRVFEISTNFFNWQRGERHVSSLKNAIRFSPKRQNRDPSNYYQELLCPESFDWKIKFTDFKTPKRPPKLYHKSSKLWLVERLLDAPNRIFLQRRRTISIDTDRTHTSHPWKIDFSPKTPKKWPTNLLLRASVSWAGFSNLVQPVRSIFCF